MKQSQDTVFRITTGDVMKAQREWGDAIVRIGCIYDAGGDYREETLRVIEALYAYDESEVLFKPTKAVEEQFRDTKQSALSYFAGGGTRKEDAGFAIHPWSNVWFEDKQRILIEENIALAMGNYYFTDARTGEEVKAEYTFGYKWSKDGSLKIFLHHSSLPYLTGCPPCIALANKS